MTDFSARSTATEWMDTEPVTEADFAACLADLETVNRLTQAYRPTLNFLNSFPPPPVAGAGGGGTARTNATPLRILDVGYGHGDMLRKIHRWAARAKIPVSLTGIDLNPSSAASARAATPPEWNIDYLTGDVLTHAPAAPVDLIISSLFTHHLENPDVVRFVAWMERTARLGWFINDLHRSRLAHTGFRALSTLAGWHRFVRHDGPVSIARSFRPADWKTLLAETPEAKIERWFPYRLCIRRIAPSPLPLKQGLGAEQQHAPLPSPLPLWEGPGEG